MRHLIFLFTLVVLSVQMAGQTSYTWYFGTNAGIRFNSDGSTSPMPGSSMVTGEGCTVVSDVAGNIKFYSDGLNLWSSASSTPVCTTLPGGQSSTQAALAIAIPGSGFQKYLIFTTKGIETSGAHDLGIALVNVTGTAPNYNVSVDEPALSVLPVSGAVMFAEKLAATSDNNGGYWVIAHDYTSGSGSATTFYKYHITQALFSGVATTAQAQAALASVQQTQSAGVSHSNTSPPAYNAQGQMKFSKNGQKLGLVLSGSKTIEIFNFDIVSGNLTQIATTNITGSTGNLYGCEFSPGGNFFYCSEGFSNIGTSVRKIYQFDISGGTLPNPYIVASGINTVIGNRYKYNAMQLGPNNKIYCSEEHGISYLSVIGSPDNGGAACGWISGTVPVSGTNTLGLPCVANDIPADNNPPVAVVDYFVTPEDIVLSGTVITNDYDTDGNLSPNGFSLVTPPVHGTVVFGNNGSFTYTPVADYNGNDTFIYSACDLGLPALCDTAIVRITVNPVNDPPVVFHESFSTCSNTPVSGNILSNGDYDPEGTALTAIATPVAPPLHGTVTVSSNGTFTYIPDPTYGGTDIFVISVCDNGIPLPGICRNDTCSISVIPAAVPDAGPDLSTCQNQSVTITGATAQNYSGILWAHNGAGSLGSPNTLSPTYYPSFYESGQVIQDRRQNK